MTPEITIIIPCYNQGVFLDDCLQSVVAQTFENWECIIVNDGSPDNTSEIALRWTSNDKRFKYIEKENGGLSSARNAGLRIATGRFIQLLDCDDLIEENKLLNHLQHFSRDFRIDVSVSGYRFFRNSKHERLVFGNQYALPETVLTLDDNDALLVFNQKNPFVISAPMYKISVFEKVGLFDEDLKAYEDKEFHLRCALHGIRFCHMGYGTYDKTLIRLHNNSMMNDAEHMNKNEEMFILKRNSNPLYQKHFKIGHTNPIQSKNSIPSILRLFLPPIFGLLRARLKKILKFNF